jgi:hypothetical protein
MSHRRKIPLKKGAPKNKKRKKTNANSGELVYDLSSHLLEETVPTPSTEEMPLIFVPARILCFLKDSPTGRTWAVIHTCQSPTKTHSLLTRSWKLSYNDDNTPDVRLVDSSTISCQLMMTEESPGLPEHKPASDLMYETSDRRHHWPTLFKKVAFAGLDNYVPSVAKQNKKARQTTQRTQN